MGEKGEGNGGKGEGSGGKGGGNWGKGGGNWEWGTPLSTPSLDCNSFITKMLKCAAHANIPSSIGS